MEPSNLQEAIRLFTDNQRAIKKALDAILEVRETDKIIIEYITSQKVIPENIEWELNGQRALLKQNNKKARK